MNQHGFYMSHQSQRNNNQHHSSHLHWHPQWQEEWLGLGRKELHDDTGMRPFLQCQEHNLLQWQGKVHGASICRSTIHLGCDLQPVGFGADKVRMTSSRHLTESRYVFHPPKSAAHPASNQRRTFDLLSASPPFITHTVNSIPFRSK